jgi:muramoyltetrapeptide carboxypeptidase
VAEYDYPVCFGFPTGHFDDNRALILGREATLNVSKGMSELVFI